MCWTSEKKRMLSNRLKSVEGHIRGIERMIQDDAYCMDILKQIKAVQQALERVSALTLENHLNTCVTTAIRSDDEAETRTSRRRNHGCVQSDRENCEERSSRATTSRQ